MNKILITGAGGYIGSIAADLLLKNGYEVIGIDNFSTGYKQPLEMMQQKYGQQKFRFYNLNLVTDNLSEVLGEEPNIEAAIHFAAFCSVGESEKDPAKYFLNNSAGSLNLLEAMIKSGIKKLVFSSTCAIYGESKYLPIDENHPQNPINPYGESKKIVEQMLNWFSNLKDLNYVALRYFNVTGASDDSSLGDSKNPSIHLIQNAVKGALGLDKFYLSYPEVDTPDKSPVRDYINVVDLGLAHLKALEYLLGGGKSESINIGTGEGNSVLEIIKTVEDLTNAKLDKEIGDIRKGDPANLIASIDKAKTVLGWKPERSLDDSVKSLISWYKNKSNGWEY